MDLHRLRVRTLTRGGVRLKADPSPNSLVEHELELSLADLQSQFEVVTLPITLVCAGNRRKEQNMVRKSLGFSWGAAGLSTALFTGVYLSDILARAKPRNEGSWGPEGWIGRRAAHVIFEGAEDLPDGKYGTSQLLRWCEDKGKGMMLAWAMNGEPLEPDHGYPLRLVVPGQIGGRSVKWLKKVEVSDIESQHHLHFWDNKVLPTTLMPEQARAERHWWYDRESRIVSRHSHTAHSRCHSSQVHHHGPQHQLGDVASCAQRGARRREATRRRAEGVGRGQRRANIRAVWLRLLWWRPSRCSCRSFAQRGRRVEALRGRVPRGPLPPRALRSRRLG